ncbi:histidinol-phosphatase [Phenylobacterium sp.]|uniref:histidinol-phosphatase n=1 Tax=Phenylobacterium sp. TaxID=1871053 RepID=UPI00120E0C39|nr:histidinol-phosphatase [Phenylobacterium sp.]THD59263.1 MAG: histidinol-phosphatase [Phenylobacterium sp.]
MTAPNPQTLASEKFVELDAFLVELNRAAGAAILPLFRADHGLIDKGGAKGFDPVTEADKGAERAIRAMISERYPDHGVIGEEYGEDRADAEFVWVLDPVDGTRAFIAGLPVWTTLIGLRHNGTPVLGSIGQPFLDEIYIGNAGGSRLMSRGGVRPLKVRSCSGLSGALIATTDPAIFQGVEREAWGRVRAAARLARLGCDAYAYAMVAAGTIDLVIETRLMAWDIDAAIPVIAGAGGITTDWEGQPVGAHGGRVAIAGDRACLGEALAALASAAP